MTHPLNSADIIIFYQKSATFAILRNTDKDCIVCVISISFDFV